MKPIGVIGASSLVGADVISRLTQSGTQVLAFSRKAVDSPNDLVIWCQLGVSWPRPELWHGDGRIEDWLCLAPIWVLPDYFNLLESCGVRRIVALSSTSRFVKATSSDIDEQELATRLAEGEAQLTEWADASGIETTILRPTLIYGKGQDRNISEIARLIRRFGFFPLLGEGRGLRQPVHVEDVAAACIAALKMPAPCGKAYNLAGGEVLPYDEMVRRVFYAIGLKPKLVHVPFTGFRVAVALLRLLPRYRHWTASMAERMGQNLVFDYEEAAKDLNYAPRPFVLNGEDIPR